MKRYKKYTVDFTNVKYYLEMHNVIRDSLDFPDYYGCNWDAFWDCLTDMYGDRIHIEILGLDVIRERFDGSADMIIKILTRFKHFSDDLFSDDLLIEVVEGNIRTVIE